MYDLHVETLNRENVADDHDARLAALESQPRMSDADVARVLDSLKARVRLLEDGMTALTARVDELTKEGANDGE